MLWTDSSGLRVRETMGATTEWSNRSCWRDSNVVGDSDTTGEAGSCTPIMHMKPSIPSAFSSTLGSWLEVSSAATSLAAPSSLMMHLHSSSLLSSLRAPVACSCASAPLPSLQSCTRGGIAPAFRTGTLKGRSRAISLRAPAAIVRACSDDDSVSTRTSGGRPPQSMTRRLFFGSDTSRNTECAHSSFVLTSPSPPSSTTSCLIVPTSPATSLALASSDSVRSAVAAASCRCQGL
mmetsp:Transcript_19272/g.48428  ORF Transcript_19272/g.48428 Transcript_19272/m.48428 type:complete len:235 (-) Transcript_19272:643-1347(-)